MLTSEHSSLRAKVRQELPVGQDSEITCGIIVK